MCVRLFLAEQIISIIYFYVGSGINLANGHGFCLKVKENTTVYSDRFYDGLQRYCKVSILLAYLSNLLFLQRLLFFLRRFCLERSLLEQGCCGLLGNYVFPPLCSHVAGP